MSTHNMFSSRNKKNIMRIPPPIYSYDTCHSSSNILDKTTSSKTNLFKSYDKYDNDLKGVLVL